MIRGMIALLLTVAIFLSATAVVFVNHQARKLFAELQTLQGVRDHLNVEWGRLQLEQSTWATDGRIERTAAERLDMLLPPAGEVVLVRP